MSIAQWCVWKDGVMRGSRTRREEVDVIRGGGSLPASFSCPLLSVTNTSKLTRKCVVKNFGVKANPPNIDTNV